MSDDSTNISAVKHWFCDHVLPWDDDIEKNLFLLESVVSRI